MVDTFKFEPGDIILLKQRKYNIFRWIITTIVQLFKFFFMRSGLVEAMAKFYHVEMFFYGDYVFTEQPPKAHFAKLPKTKIRVFRLIHQDRQWLNFVFFIYAASKINMPFDFWKFLGAILDKIFGTTWFTRHFINPVKDICGESVARFYAEIIKVRCSTQDPESTIPADINEYCSDHPSIFQMVRDDR